MLCTTCEYIVYEVLPKSTTHTYDNVCDPDCNVCGLIRETAHNFSKVWTKGVHEHWHACTKCGETKVEDIINDETLDSIVSSETISGTLITIAQDENVNLDIHEKIDEESRDAISDAISNFENGKELDEKTTACLDALRDLLGIGK